jgi:hypothetical protein
VQRREFRDVDPPGIGDDQLGTALQDRLAELRPKHGMLLGRIRADDEQRCS